MRHRSLPSVACTGEPEAAHIPGIIKISRMDLENHEVNLYGQAPGEIHKRPLPHHGQYVQELSGVLAVDN